MSCPTQNARPAPVSTTARTAGSAASARAAPSAACRSSVSAFSRSGRFSVMVATAPARVSSTSGTLPSLPARLEDAERPTADRICQSDARHPVADEAALGQRCGSQGDRDHHSPESA